MGSFGRKIARAQARRQSQGANPLATALQSLGDLGGMAGAAAKIQEQIQQLNDVFARLEESRVSLEETREQLVETIEASNIEIERQRYVFSRFILAGTPRGATYQDFLAIEEQYRLEYDVLRVLVQLLMWAKEAQ
jgi:hypothetical protein